MNSLYWYNSLGRKLRFPELFIPGHTARKRQLGFNLDLFQDHALATT